MILFNCKVRSLWSACRVIFVNNVNNSIVKNRIRLYTAQVEAMPKKTIRSMRTKKKEFNLDDFAWAMLVIPVSAFGLGTWQIFRKVEKEAMLEKLKERTNLPPVEFPEDLSKLSEMEYMPVKVKGRFDHSKEILLGPRSRLVNNQNYKNTGSLLSTQSAGFVVITPFKLTDRNLTILVNRGWVPASQMSPHTRQMGQITDEVELIALVRKSENRQPLGMKNYPERGLWTYRDSNKMAEIAGTAPIIVDALESSSVPGGPLGGQSVIELRNEHLLYILTWYGLAAATGVMWYNRFIRKVPI